MRKIIDATDATYDDLRKDERVRTALTMLGGLRLGPSQAYEKTVSQIEQFERYVKEPTNP